MNMLDPAALAAAFAITSLLACPGMTAHVKTRMRWARSTSRRVQTTASNRFAAHRNAVRKP